jgi:hypothetical protein
MQVEGPSKVLPESMQTRKLSKIAQGGSKLNHIPKVLTLATDPTFKY